VNYLLIEDDETFASVLCRALQKRGLTAEWAESSELAFSLCREKSFQRIVLDLKLGEENGLNLISDLVALQPDASILVLTGYSSISTAVKAMQLGAINYLCKPATADEVIAAFEPEQGTVPEVSDKPPSVERLEWEHIQSVLEKNHGNISATARDLGMHRRTLQRKLQKRPVKN